MAYWLVWLRNRLNEESGQDTTEYALLIMLIVITLVVVVILARGWEVLRDLLEMVPSTAWP